MVSTLGVAGAAAACVPAKAHQGSTLRPYYRARNGPTSASVVTVRPSSSALHRSPCSSVHDRVRTVGREQGRLLSLGGGSGSAHFQIFAAGNGSVGLSSSKSRESMQGIGGSSARVAVGRQRNDDTAVRSRSSGMGSSSSSAFATGSTMHCGFGTKRSRARLVAGGPGRGWVVQPPRYGTRGVRAQAAAGEDGGAEANKMTLEEVKEMLNKPLERHTNLRKGSLANGLQYFILPNAVPPNRLEVHLEMHVGSVDEREDEQGLAHLVEHVTFLGSSKREQLLSLGRSNAYTDFHHTVFHVHAPVKSDDGKVILPQVLEALDEIAFQPKFDVARIEKERRAVLAETQMMNTIEYRVDCKLLQQLHMENALGSRFPIGLEEQVKKWDRDALRRFHERWYFPANATLFLVGDFDGSVEDAEKMIEAAFGQVPAARLPPPAPNVPGDIKLRHAVRPPVMHALGVPDPSETAADVIPTPEAGAYVFQHPLLQQFSLSLFQKLPVLKMKTYADLRKTVMARFVVMALHFRISTRYAEPNPPFTFIEFDHSDSGREGCTVSTLTITSEPERWKEALRVALEEVRILHAHGITKAELLRYTTTAVRDSERLAEQEGSVPSIDNLDFVMESETLGHEVMDQQQGHEVLLQVLDTITLEDIKTVAQELLAYVAEYGTPLELRQCPTGGVCTTLVACVPDTVVTESEDGSVSSEAPFQVVAKEIEDALCEKTGNVEAPTDVEVPDRLISTEDVAELMKREPKFVPVDQPVGADGMDPKTAVTLRKLSNGILVNYRRTTNEPKGAMLRLVAKGGRTAEQLMVGGQGLGSVAVGVRTLSEVGTVGDWDRRQMEQFCLSHLIYCTLEPDEEFVAMDLHFPVANHGIRSVLELVHLVLEKPRWETNALDRAKQNYLSHYRTQQKSLERATSARLMDMMLGPDRRFMDPSPEEVSALKLEDVVASVQAQLLSGNLEVSVVGDFDPEELDKYILQYLGTVQERHGPMAPEVPMLLNSKSVVPSLLRTQRWHLQDSDERACAYLSGPAPNRWAPLPMLPAMDPAILAAAGPLDPTDFKNPLVRRSHPLYTFISLSLLVSLINGRLFTTVRDDLGLTYDVSFDLTMFDRLEVGWFLLTVTAMPHNIENALAASLGTVRGLPKRRVTQRELDRARRTSLTRHESDLKSNDYWLSLLTHVQSPAVPMKTLQCIADLPAMYEAATVDDVYHAYSGLSLGDDDIFSCIGVSGQTASQTPGTPPPPPQAPVLQQAIRSGQQGAEAAGRNSLKTLSTEAASTSTTTTEETMAKNAVAAAAAVVAAFKTAKMGDALKEFVQNKPPSGPEK